MCKILYVARGKLLYNSGSPTWCSVITWRGWGWGGEEREAQEEENFYMIRADSHCYMAETNTTS